MQSATEMRAAICDRSPRILIGYRGTGKTTVARILASRLGVRAVDSDPEIERQLGKTIAEIFEQDGEAAFRDHEARIIRELLEKAEGPLVLATGGGAILRPETRRLLNESGQVAWLTASPETILQRIREDAASKTTRPGLTSLPMFEEIVSLLEKRAPLYRETAHRIVETDHRTPEEIVEILLRRQS